MSLDRIFNEISFSIPGEPVAKGRARVTVNRKTGHAFAYTPDKTAKATNEIRELVSQLDLDCFEREVPLAMTITSVLTKPKSVKKSRKYPTTRPDWDNYAKLVSDAIEKFAYEDDAQIVDVVYKKRYGSSPRTEVTIRAKD